jgi:hypothetical protein
MSNQTKYCHNCGTPILIKNIFCVNCGARQSTHQQHQVSPQTPTVQPVYNHQYSIKQHVSILWYFAPLLFAILGGVIAWYINKDKDPGKARNFLIFGAIMTIVNYFLLSG